MSRSSSSCLGGLGVMAVWWKPRRIQKHSEAAQIHPIYSKYSTQSTQSRQSTQRMISGYWTSLDRCTYGFKPQALDGHLSLQFRGAWAPQITGWQVNRVTEWRQVERVRNVKTQTISNLMSRSERLSMLQSCMCRSCANICKSLFAQSWTLSILQRLQRSRPLYIGIAHLTHMIYRWSYAYHCISHLCISHASATSLY